MQVKGHTGCWKGISIITPNFHKFTKICHAGGRVPDNDGEMAL